MPVALCSIVFGSQRVVVSNLPRGTDSGKSILPTTFVSYVQMYKIERLVTDRGTGCVDRGMWGK